MLSLCVVESWKALGFVLLKTKQRAMDDLVLLKGRCASNKLEPFKYCAREQKVLNLQVVASFHILTMAICEPTIELEAFLLQLQ
jgi:hypothetical protein